MMIENYNTVSFFNGMNCGAMAMEVANVPIGQYWSYEIDKHAMRSTQETHRNTIQMGSVVDFDINDFKNIRVDLFIGGSPCQSFSFAGKRKGMSTKDEIEILTLDHYLQLKSEGYEFEGQSYLFWEYMRALTELRKLNPDIKFLLENVMMGEKWEKILTKAIGVNPIEINSALVSAQNRRRLYWTNIGMVPAGLFGDPESIIQQPKDRGILLKNILEPEVDQKYFLSGKMLSFLDRKKTRDKEKGNGFSTEISDGFDKSNTITQRYYKDGHEQLIKNPDEKASCFTAGGNSGGKHSQMDLIVHNTMPRSSISGKGGTGHLSRTDGKTYCLDTGNTNAVEKIRRETGSNPKRFKEIKERTDGKVGALLSQPTVENTIAASESQHPNRSIRRLTPRECGRLQTVPTHHLETMLSSGISDTQLYRMFGNGWTVDVIAHIFNYLNYLK